MTLHHESKREPHDLASGPSAETLDFQAAAALACAVFAVAYWLFRWCQPWIVSVHASFATTDIVPWAR